MKPQMQVVLGTFFFLLSRGNAASQQFYGQLGWEENKEEDENDGEQNERPGCCVRGPAGALGPAPATEPFTCMDFWSLTKVFPSGSGGSADAAAPALLQIQVPKAGNPQIWELVMVGVCFPTREHGAPSAPMNSPYGNTHHPGGKKTRAKRSF